MTFLNSKSTLMLAAIGLTACAVIVSSMNATAVAAAGANADDCRMVQGRLTALRVTEGCTNPLGCFAGSISGSGLLNGTFTEESIGIAPSAGLPGIEPPTTLSVAGERVITTKRGTLTLHLLAVFDTVTGEFDELENVTGGTGQFAGTTGTLHLFGRATNADLFEGDIIGEICLAH